MCELSNFYLKFIKENSTPNPEKPILTLTKENYQKLMKLLEKNGPRL
jgi:hypothetical protein